MEASPSRLELAFYFALCPLAGLGVGLALASLLLGLIVTGLGVFAIAAYFAARGLNRWTSVRREPSQRLSVTDISTLRRAAASQAPRSDDTHQAADPSRVVPLRMHSYR
jgi:hypothetical protein